MLIFFIIIILGGSFLVRGAGGCEILSALISWLQLLSGLPRWFWYTPVWASDNAIWKKKKRKRVFPIGPIYILYVCSVMVCFPWEHCLPGAGRASALFHIAFVLAKLSPLPGRVIKAVSVNPANIYKLNLIKTIKRRYWFHFKAPGFDFGMRTLVSTDPWRRQWCHDKRGPL